MDCTIKLTDVVMVLATLLSPFFAVQASEKLRKISAAKDAREKLLHTLMSTRSARLTQEHVSAVNQIDLIFPANKFPAVSDAWNMYMRHLSQPKPQGQQDSEKRLAETFRLFIAMLKVMAQAVGTPFSDTALQHNAYYPQGFVDTEEQIKNLREAALKVLMGEQPIAINPAKRPNEKD